MKAILKETGKIINVIPNPITPNTYRHNDIVYGRNQLDIIIDWEQRRYEIAKAAIQGVCNDYDSVPDTESKQRFFAEFAVKFADALINELKKK